MSQYSRRDGVMSVELDGETVLLDTLSGQYFRLNETGTLVWMLLEHPASLDDLAASVHEQTVVADDVLRGDLTALLATLEEQRLVVAQ